MFPSGHGAAGGGEIDERALTALTSAYTADQSRRGAAAMAGMRGTPGSKQPLTDRYGNVIGSWDTETGLPSFLSPGQGVTPYGEGFRRAPAPAGAMEERGALEAILSDIGELKAVLQDPVASAKIKQRFGGPFGIRGLATRLQSKAGMEDDPDILRFMGLLTRLSPQQAFDTGGKTLPPHEWRIISQYLPMLSQPLPTMMSNIGILGERLGNIYQTRFGEPYGGGAGAPNAAPGSEGPPIPPGPAGQRIQGPDGSIWVSDGKTWTRQ
jgi:hypothetical protein